ncbi:hypothetical protein H0W91_01390 [Patescibacteria group bacterium]|nr:hypothetical protein [Patescibacteria group bacterium]
MTSPEGVTQPNLPSEILVPEHLTEGQKARLSELREKYAKPMNPKGDRLSEPGIIDIPNILSHIANTHASKKETYGFYIVSHLNDEGSLDLIKLREELDKESYYMTPIDQMAWAEAATDVKRDLDRVLNE